MDIRKLIKDNIRDIMIYEPGKEEADYVKLSSNENPEPPDERIVAAVTRAARNSNRYPPSGSPNLTEALARRHGVSAGEVMVGNGSNEIIDLLVRGFVKPGENLVYPVPSFIVYGLIAKICDVGGKGVLCRDYKLDLPAMRAAVDEKTRMVFLCNPNNPTSTYVTADEVNAFLDGLREDVLVVIDEAYFDYVDAEDYPDSLALRQQRNTIITLRTFSKFYAIAGIRVGYAVADPAVIDALHRTRQPFNVSLIAQAGAMAALEVAEELQPKASVTVRERQRVREAILELGWACPPSQANFVFVDLGESDLDLFAALHGEGVIVRRMGQFGSAKNTYRVSIGTPEENDRLIAGLKHARAGQR